MDKEGLYCEADNEIQNREAGVSIFLFLPYDIKPLIKPDDISNSFFSLSK